MKTGEDVLARGRYASRCCAQEQTFDIPEVFHRCPHCHELCEWELAEDQETQSDGAALTLHHSSVVD